MAIYFKNYLSGFSFLIMSQWCFSSTVFTVKDGFWGDNQVWSNIVVPNATDSIYILHHVFFTEDISIESLGFLQIDSSGILCGHKTIRSVCGGIFYNYNLVQADSFYLTDGSNFGTIQFLKFIRIAPCLFSFFTGISKGGYAFSCNASDTTASIDSTEIDTLLVTTPPRFIPVNIYPNPFLSYFTITTQIPDSNAHITLNIYDLLGRKIKTVAITNGNSQLTILTDTWVAGFYLLSFMEDKKIIQNFKMVKIN